MGKYIDGSGLSHFMGILKGAFASKSVAISNITRSGTTFTATRADGTSFTFTQQDNTVSKTSTTPKMNGTAAVGSESAYAAGDHVHPSDTSRVPTTRTVNGHALSSDVTITASDIGVSSGAEVNQNAFSSVMVNSTTAIDADSKTDTLNLNSDDGISLSANSANDTITIGLDGRMVKSVNGTSPDSFGNVAISASELFAASTSDGDTIQDALDFLMAAQFDGAGLNYDTLLDDTLATTHYTVCETAAGTAAKTATLSGYELYSGSIVYVKFANSNSATGGLTLNVNNTGAKAIKYHGSNVSVSSNRIYAFLYDGTNWEMIGDLDTQYSDFTAATSNAAGTHGLVPAPAAGTNSQDLVLSSGGGWKGVGDIITDQAAIGGSATQGFITVGAQISGYPRPVGIVDIPVYGQKVFHAVCETAAATPDKVATLDDTNGYSLTAGVTVAVTFKYGNSATSPTLQVTHGSDAKKTIAAPKDATGYAVGNGTTCTTWGAYETILFTYSGSYWVHSGSGRALYQAYTLASSAAPKASPALTGTPTAPTAAAGTNTTQIATTAFVANAVSSFASGALQYKGTVTAESVITSSAYKKGWYWIVNMPNSTTTSITVAGKSCEAGDMIIAKQDKTSTLADDIDIIQSNIEVLSNGEIDTLWAAA